MPASLRINTTACNRIDAENVVKIFCKKPDDANVRQTQWNDSSSVQEAIDLSGKIVIATHGYILGYNNDSGSLRELIHVWSDTQKVTACAIDYSFWSSCAYYKATSEHVFRVADFIARFVDQLRQNHNVPTENIILAGHSLGAVAIGAAANQLVPKMKLCYGE